MSITDLLHTPISDIFSRFVHDVFGEEVSTDGGIARIEGARLSDNPFRIDISGPLGIVIPTDFELQAYEN